MKQLRTTLVLLLIAAIFGGYLYFNERGPTVGEGAVVLLRVQRDTVQTIRLEPKTGPGVELRRSGEAWMVASLKGGDAVPADADDIKSLLDALQLVQSQSPVESPEKLEEYGLDKPSARLVVGDQTLLFGAKPKFDPSHIYAKAGEQIALVPSGLSDQVAKSFDDWRDTAVLRFDSSKATRISLQTPQLKVSFQQVGNDWTLTQPLAAPAENDTVDGLTSGLSAAHISKWLDESGSDATKWGLDKPTATLSIGDATLQIGKKQQGGYAARNLTSKAIFLLPDATYALFNRPLRDWRDKKVAHFSLGAATRLAVTSGTSTKVLVKNGDSWQLEGGSPDQKMHGAALDILSFANDLKANDFVDGATVMKNYGLDKPFLTLEIEADSGADLVFGRSNNKLFAKNLLGKSDSGTIFVLDGGTMSAVQDALGKLFSRSKK